VDQYELDELVIMSDEAEVGLGTTQDRCQFSEQLQMAFYDSHG